MYACLGSPVTYQDPYGVYCKFIDVCLSTAKSCILRQVLLAPAGIIESTEPIADYSAAT